MLEEKELKYKALSRTVYLGDITGGPHRDLVDHAVLVSWSEAGKKRNTQPLHLTKKRGGGGGGGGSGERGNSFWLLEF